MTDTGADTSKYSAEEVKHAEEQLAKMTPDDYLDWVNYIRMMEDQESLPEAAGSATAMIVGFGGAEVLVTARGVSIDVAYDSLAAKLERLFDAGCFPVKRYTSEYDVPGADRDTIPTVQAPVPEPVETKPVVQPTIVSQPIPVPVQAGQQAQPTQPAQPLATFFTAEFMEATTRGGKEYWKVYGGPFVKYGVTIWPEIMEAAGLIGLDASARINVSGWTAEYVVNERGNPQKVVAMHPPKR